MQKRSCQCKIKCLHPNHPLTSAALASELNKFLLDTREIKTEIKCHLLRFKSFPGLNSSPCSNKVNPHATAYWTYQITRSTAFQITISHQLPAALPNTNTYNLSFRNAIQQWVQQYFCAFFLHTAPPFPQFCTLWASFALPNKKQNFNYLASGRLRPCSSLHRVLHMWYYRLTYRVIYCFRKQRWLLWNTTQDELY